MLSTRKIKGADLVTVYVTEILRLVGKIIQTGSSKTTGLLHVLVDCGTIIAGRHLVTRF